MIPKIIHYCWFGQGMPKKIKENILSWKDKLSDYEFIEWNENNFPIDSSCQFVKEAFANHKWAFVSDYVRLYALSMFGGIYLDTDVEIIKNFDDFLIEELFLSHESAETLCTAVIGAEKGNEIILGFLRTYSEKTFIVNEKFDVTPNSILLKKYCESIIGAIDFDKEYIKYGIHIFPRTYFCAKDIHNYKLDKTDNTVSIHHLEASWYSPWHKFLRGGKKIIRTFINKFSHFNWR